MATVSEINRGYLSTSVAPGSVAVSDEYAFVLTREGSLQKLKTAPGTTNERVVRRPFGVEFKPNTYAYLEVLRSDDDGRTLVPIMIFNENHPLSSDVGGTLVQNLPTNGSFPNYQNATAPYTNNFLIQSFQESREEKYQIVETFGDNFLFLFGERPRFVDIQGLLLSTRSHQWEKEWWLNYDRFLRGTRAIENKSIVTLHVDGAAISGYILGASSQKSSQVPRLVTFTFRMIVTDYVPTDNPVNGLNFFADNLYKNSAEADGTTTGLLGKGTGNLVADAVEGAVSDAKSVINTGLLRTAASIVTQAAFGNPLGATTDGIAAAVAVAERLTGINTLGELSPFSSGVGSLVEFQGKPIEMYPVPGPSGSTTTLQKAGVSNLVASVDNSLSILLNMSRSPVIQALGSVGKLVQGAISALGASSVSFATDAESGYNSFLSRAGKREPGSGLVVSGRYMGFDFVVPMKGFKNLTVNPPTKAAVDLSSSSLSEQVSGGAYGSPKDYEFFVLKAYTGSGVDFGVLKRDPNYGALPREWRLMIEKNPDEMSKKILSTSRKNSEGVLEILVRRSKNSVRLESDVSRRLDELGI